MPLSAHSLKILIVANENPAWSELDRGYANAMVTAMVDGLASLGHTVQVVKYYDSLEALARFDPEEWVVFNWGEEWAGQPWTEVRVATEIGRYGFLYTGASPDALDFTRNREYIKRCLRSAGVPTLPSRILTRTDEASEWQIYPAIVKGANQHSSYGITRDSIVHDSGQLARQITWMRETLNDEAFVEPFLDTREFHVGVWGNSEVEALPPVEYDFSRLSQINERFYTYEAKFDRGSRLYNSIELVCPAPGDRPDWVDRLQKTARDAYRATGMRDYARIDMRMLGDEPQVLDVNPNPDLDPVSVIPVSCRALGLTYGQMASRIAQYAAARRPQ